MRSLKYIWVQYIFLIVCCLCLTACGFHLRGPIKLAAPLQRLYIESIDPYGQLVRNIKQYLKASHVYIAETPLDADVVLQILSENKMEQLLSVGGTQQTRQYNLILTVIFQLKKPNGQILLPPQTISESRPITIQSSQILAGSNEANNLYKIMRLSIVYSLMNRLASPTTLKLVTQAEHPMYIIRPAQ